MPNEITHGYQIECLSCGYVWNTKYSQISAKCPSCSGKIYGSGNYTIRTQYIHYEPTEQEKKEREERILKTITISVFGIFILISLMTGSIGSFFFFSIILGVIIYFFTKSPKERAAENKKGPESLRGEKSVTIKGDKKEVKTTFNCPKCGKEVEYTHKVGKEGSINIQCRHCKSTLNLSTNLTSQYGCKHCGKIYGTKEQIERHEKRCKKSKTEK